jgi:hypothetical protein
MKTRFIIRFIQIGQKLKANFYNESILLYWLVIIY